jgi:alcohol dehydrogenase (cytochrome c)
MKTRIVERIAAGMRRIGSAVVTLAMMAGCAGHYPNYPITQHGVLFPAMDASMPKSAPDVLSRVNGDRIRLAEREPQNWLTYYGTYDGHRYSALDQISTDNVGTLKVAWQFQYGLIGLVASPATYAFETTPIVVDGVMFISGSDGYVWALDAVTGRSLWRYRFAVPLDVPLCCGNVNRGVAVAQGKVIVATANGHVVALDATTGRPVWDVVFVDVRAGESATMAPLVVKDMVLVGSSGAEYGVRGHIDAFDIATGARRWRRYNVPKPGEPGSETWGTEHAWERGGGTAWVTGTYDPALNLVYWGTGNPGPDFDGAARPGDNLYTNSVVAFNPDNGQLVWHYQWTPHDVWDYDGVNENILFDQGGQKLLAHFDKNGFLYILDRTNGRFVRAARFGNRVTWGNIDASTGRITVQRVPTSEGTQICPGPAGAKEWPHASYSRQTHLLYTPVVDICATFMTDPQEFKESLPYWGSAATADQTIYGGAVKAFDPATGSESWSYPTRHPVVSSLLTTAGGLVFVGEATGEFDALDARSGRLLWQFNTGSGIHGSAISYSVNGKQYVAVPTGWGGWMKGFAPELYGESRGNALVVFALP